MSMHRTKSTLTAIDLFSGAGALSAGLKKAGFKVVAAVEINKKVTPTYQMNHKATLLFEKDIREVKGTDILKRCGRAKIDLIAGCPPCQGFSQLTEKYRRYDPRNDLALEMARLVEELDPRMVMMENVPGLATKGRRILNQFVRRLQNRGYLINMGVLQLADYGIPQTRRRFVLLAGKGFFIDLPKQTHSRKGDKSKKLKPWVTFGQAVGTLNAPITFSEAKKQGGPEKFGWHVVRDLTDISLKRLAAVGQGTHRSEMPVELRPQCHKKNNKGFGNVYGRIGWDQTPPTITSGCTTPCMGRFGHPRELRTLSIKEAAMIQTFPKRYRFKTEYMDVACDLVGNALPTEFAKIAARSCMKALNEEGTSQ